MTPAQRDTAVNVLAKSTLFSDIDAAILQRMVGNLDAEQWSVRRIVMAPHQTVERFYLLVAGRVKITRQNIKTGREITLFLLGPGDAFNVVSLLDGRQHEVYAQTLDTVDAVSGPVELWKDWLETYPALRLAMRGYIYQRLHHLAELACDLALHDTMTRLSHLLLNHCIDIGEHSCTRLSLIEDLPHEELAQMIGTVRVVVNRLLSELKREGIVDTNGGKLQVLNLDKLLQKAEQRIRTPPSASDHPVGLSPP